MKVLIACEFSGIVREAFRKKGHDAWSCDLLPAEDNSPYHKQIDVRALLGYPNWDIIIAFPPCTHLAVSGARWFKEKELEQQKALDFVRLLLNPPSNDKTKLLKIALENPISIISTKIRKPDQIIQPWQFGHPEIKATCLWLQNLPLLKPTKTVPPPYKARVHLEPPGPERWKNRSRTYKGIADAMADQWGNIGNKGIFD